MSIDGLTKLEAKVLEAIGGEPKTVEEIAELTGGAVVYIRDILTRMDYTGLAVRHEPLPARWQAVRR